MTAAQKIIIEMIHEGKRNTDIVQHTGKTPEYVSKVRRRLAEDPNCFETGTLVNKINNGKPKRKDYSGRVECLRCEKLFDSEDRRSNRICPKCSGEKNNVQIDLESARSAGHFLHIPKEWRG